MEECRSTIVHPLLEIKQLYAEDKTIVNNLNKVGDHFRRKVVENESQIPWYNSVPLECLPPNSMVRFRGMIQDMMDPEFYLATYTVTNSTTKVQETRIGAYMEPVEQPN